MDTALLAIAETNDACGEAPLWDMRAGKLFWADIVNQRLHTCDWPSKTVHTVPLRVPVSALALTESGELVIAGSEGIWLRTCDGMETLIAQDHEGEVLAINDCIADEHGSLLAGSTFFDSTDTYPRGSLYLLRPDGMINVLDRGFGLANGMGFSPDGRTLYMTDSAERRIYAYDYNAGNGVVAHRRTFVQVSASEGLPDGLTVDADGFVWSAQWFGACICRYDPDGHLERRIRIPADQTSSLAFGGAELTDIFITSAAVPDALLLAPAGYTKGANCGGQLFHLNLGIQGREEHRCRIPYTK